MDTHSEHNGTHRRNPHLGHNRTNSTRNQNSQRQLAAPDYNEQIEEVEEQMERTRGQLDTTDLNEYFILNSQNSPPKLPMIVGRNLSNDRADNFEPRSVKQNKSYKLQSIQSSGSGDVIYKNNS